MFIYLYVFVTLGISVAAFKNEQYGFALFELTFMLMGIYIHLNLHRPEVREWIDKYF